MGVFNRRNAVVGWLAWTAGKRVVKKKAKGAVPAIDATSKKPNKSAIALLVASAAGALTFWKKRSGGDDPPPS
jgi:CRISPR/Cas system-associated protein Csm6